MIPLCAFLLAGGTLLAQVRPEQASLPAERVFKNIQVLKGIPADEFMATMGFFSASLGLNCTDCHGTQSAGSWEKYADETPKKQIARRMVAMVGNINKEYFGGRRMLTCYSCHRGSDRPRLTPSLAELYGPPTLDEPDDIRAQAPNAPSADQILDKYIQAVGGAEALRKITSFVARGNYQGYADTEKRPVEIYAKAPSQRSVIVHTLAGDSTTVYDGRAGWSAAPANDSPIPVLELTGGELDGARLDAELSFPARIKQALTQWRVGFPTVIDDREVQEVQGTMDGRHPVNLYFDNASGFLIRQVRYADSPVGLSPTQIDYSEYREVAGIKMPFVVKIMWLDGRSTTELVQIQPSATIDAVKFAKPAPSAPPAK